MVCVPDFGDLSGVGLLGGHLLLPRVSAESWSSLSKQQQSRGRHKSMFTNTFSQRMMTVESSSLDFLVACWWHHDHGNGRLDLGHKGSEKGREGEATDGFQIFRWPNLRSPGCWVPLREVVVVSFNSFTGAWDKLRWWDTSHVPWCRLRVKISVIVFQFRFFLRIVKKCETNIDRIFYRPAGQSRKQRSIPSFEAWEVTTKLHIQLYDRLQNGWQFRPPHSYISHLPRRLQDIIRSTLKPCVSLEKSTVPLESLAESL